MTRHLLITAAAFTVEGEIRAMLMLEDATEIVELADATPVCFGCGKAHESPAFWDRMRACFQNQWGIDLSRKLCPDCAAKFYPDIEASLERGATTTD